MNNPKPTTMDHHDNVNMETKRDYFQLDSDFNEARSTASCVSDLLMCHHDKMTLDDSTVTDAGMVCFNQVKIMGKLFTELLDLYTEEMRK